MNDSQNNSNSEVKNNQSNSASEIKSDTPKAKSGENDSTSEVKNHSESNQSEVKESNSMKKNQPKKNHSTPTAKKNQANSMHPALLNLLKSSGGASLLYLLSAGCILLGGAMVTIPIYENSPPFWERTYLPIVLNIYEWGLLFVIALVCKWKAGNSDAISLLCLISIFLVGSAIAIDTIAVIEPFWGLLFGVVGLGFAVTKSQILHYKVVRLRKKWLLGAIAILLGCNFFMPAILGYHLNNKEIVSAATKDKELTSLWLLGWWGALAAGILILLTIAFIKTKKEAEKTPNKPFLHTSLMQWIIATVILSATFLHQFTLSFSFDLKIALGDFLPVAGLITLIVLELRRIYCEEFSLRDIAISLVPLICSFVVVGSGSYTMTLSSGLGFICYPPVALGAMAFAMLALSWKRQSQVPFYIANTYLLFALLFYNTHPERAMEFNWNLAIFILAMFFAFLAALKNNGRFAIAAAALFSFSFGTSEVFKTLCMQGGITYLWPMLSIFALLSLIVYGIFIKQLSQTFAYFAAILLVFGIFKCFLTQGSVLHSPLLASLSTLIAFIMMGSWTKDWGLILPGFAPMIYSSGGFIQNNTGWLVIFASFLLLALGVFASSLKIEQEQETQ